jgi:hypothetical protein
MNNAMDLKDKSLTMMFVALIIVAVVGIIGGPILFKWYAAGVQVAVYERQGVHMTRWEVFVGAKPIVRSVITEGVQ